MPGPAPLVIYRLKVSLRHVSPMIWRRLLVRSDLTLFGLHRVIQIAFGWEDYHLHAFKVHGRRFGTQWTGERYYLIEDGEVLRELTLADLSLRLRQRILYKYDFGDSGSMRSVSRRASSRVRTNPTRFASTAPVPARPRTSVVPVATIGCSSASKTCALSRRTAHTAFWTRTIRTTRKQAMETSGRRPIEPGSTVQTIRSCAMIRRPSIAAPSTPL